MTSHIFSFVSGAVCLFLFQVMAPVEDPVWRVCKPAQLGEELVSSVQHPDRTDCFYQKRGRIKFATQLRKERT